MSIIDFDPAMTERSFRPAGAPHGRGRLGAKRACGATGVGVGSLGAQTLGARAAGKGQDGEGEMRSFDYRRIEHAEDLSGDSTRALGVE